jgi:superfamily I DNA and/or RNA helicase
MPLEKSLFDIVLFDEASQLKVEETMGALIRGRQKIIC